MIYILLRLYELFYGANERYHYKDHNRLKWIICVISFVTIRVFFFNYMKILCKLRKALVFKDNINENVIVSLTSFPARINNVWMVIDSICRQDMRPQSINLYLCEKEFQEKTIPTNLKKYIRYGLKVCWVKEEIKPHLKYYYALKDNPHKYVITIDDDIYYRNDLVSRLWEMSQLNKGAVCANRATKILNDTFECMRYNLWGSGQDEPIGVSFNYLALGTCGVIYPPELLRNSDLFDLESIKRNCLKADDLWLKCHEILNKILVATGDFYSQSIEIMGSQKISLRSTNCNDTETSGNDIQWNNLDREYGLINNLKSLVRQEKLFDVV